MLPHEASPTEANAGAANQTPANAPVGPGSAVGRQKKSFPGALLLLEFRASENAAGECGNGIISEYG